MKKGMSKILVLALIGIFVVSIAAISAVHVMGADITGKATAGDTSSTGKSSESGNIGAGGNPSNEYDEESYLGWWIEESFACSMASSACKGMGGSDSICFAAKSDCENEMRKEEHPVALTYISSTGPGLSAMSPNGGNEEGYWTWLYEGGLPKKAWVEGSPKSTNAGDLVVTTASGGSTGQSGGAQNIGFTRITIYNEDGSVLYTELIKTS